MKEVQRLVSLTDLFSFYANNNRLSLRHIPGGENPADALTIEAL